MGYEFIEVKKHTGWAEIILNRPKKMNALRPEMCEEIASAGEELASSSDIRAIVIRPNGKHFSAGFDVATEMVPTDTKGVWLANRKMQDAFRRINELPVVTICEMRGYVVGAGLLLAAVCNLRYAEPEAIFYVPELDMGIPFSLGGVATVARYIGITRTADLVLNCVKITASDVAMTDFVTKILPEAELTAHVDAVASKLAERPNSLILSSLATLREAERALMPNPASDLFTMLFVDQEKEAKSVRNAYSKRFKS